MAGKSNSYLDQVVAQQAELEEDLRSGPARSVPAPAASGTPSSRGALAKRAGRVGPVVTPGCAGIAGWAWRS